MSSGTAIMDVQSMPSTGESVKALANRRLKEDLTSWGRIANSSGNSMIAPPVTRGTSGLGYGVQGIPEEFLEQLGALTKRNERRMMDEPRRSSKAILLFSIYAENPFRETVSQILDSMSPSWESARSPFIEESTKEDSSPSLPVEKEDAIDWEQNPPTPKFVFEQLQNTNVSHSDRRQLIIEAEGLDFDFEQRVALAPLLFEFIKQYRNSGDEVDSIAVGSAIREYVAVIPVQKIGTLVELLEAEQAIGLPLEVENEIVKMIARKFTVHPPIVENPEPALAELLLSLVKSYANPRVLPRVEFASITLNALHGLVAMRAPGVRELILGVHVLSISWFNDILESQILSLAEEWEGCLNQDYNHECLSFIEDILDKIVSSRVH